MPIRLVMAEDNYLVRQGVAQLLDAQPEVEVVASCADLTSLRAAIEAHAPEVVLTDIRMPPTGSDEGLQVARELRDSHPHMGVVVLSQYADAEYALALLEGGASRRAYLLKERVSNVEQLVAAIEEVAHGGSVIDPVVVENLVAARSRASESPLNDLTPREHEVLARMAQGRNNAAIAASLFLSERAVEKHINSIFSKLQLSEEFDIHRRVKATLLYLADRPG